MDVMSLSGSLLRMHLKISLFILAAVAWIAIQAFAFSVDLLWICWLLTAGFIFGISLSALNRKTLAIAYCAIVLLFAGVLIRFAPIYELRWAEADEITISSITNDWKIALSEREEIEEFAEYGKRGHYSSMLKSGYGIHVYVTHNGSSRGYYIHGNAIGNQPGNYTQSIFVPDKDGLTQYLETMFLDHGVER